MADTETAPVFIGIDPGASGGIAILSETGEVLSVTKMLGTETDIWRCFLWAKCPRDEIPSRLFFSKPHAFIEKVHSFPGQGVASTFKFGRSYGFLRGILIASKIPFEAVQPRAWQKAMGIEPRMKHKSQLLQGKWEFTESKVQFKNRIKGVAQRLFPDQKMTLAICDALLLAEYCRRTYFERLGKTA